jgi:hypothetical protein
MNWILARYLALGGFAGMDQAFLNTTLSPQDDMGVGLGRVDMTGAGAAYRNRLPLVESQEKWCDDYSPGWTPEREN